MGPGVTKISFRAQRRAADNDVEAAASCGQVLRSVQEKPWSAPVRKLAGRQGPSEGSHPGYPPAFTKRPDRAMFPSLKPAPQQGSSEHFGTMRGITPFATSPILYRWHCLSGLPRLMTCSSTWSWEMLQHIVQLASLKSCANDSDAQRAQTPLFCGVKTELAEYLKGALVRHGILARTYANSSRPESVRSGGCTSRWPRRGRFSWPF